MRTRERSPSTPPSSPGTLNLGLGTSLELEGLGKAFGGRWAVRDLSLAVPPGSLVALLGPSGCGKTTTLRMIAGLVAPDSGDVRVGGDSILHLPAERREATLVFQQPTLFPHMDVAANVGFGLRMRGVPRGEIAARVREGLAAVQLGGYDRRKPGELSGGQQQRVALARALVASPRLLLLDEPLSSLDPSLRDEMRDLIARLHAERGITTVLVTHDRAEAMALASRVAFLSDGVLQQYDTPPGLYERPATAAVARFFGMTNLLPIRQQSAVGGRQENTVYTPLGALHIPDAFHAALGTPHAAFLVGIRPEHVRMDGDATGPNTVRGWVMARTYLGQQQQIVLHCGPENTPLVALAPAHLPVAVGDMLPVSLPPERLHLLPAEMPAGA